MSEDRWSRWFNKKSPFFGSDFPDINETFKEMEKAIAKEFEELSKRAPEDLQREQTLPDGKPQVKEFGNFKAETRLGKPHMDVKEEREPLTDVIEADDTVKIIVELPGVEKDDIKLSGTDDKLMISVETPQHKYYKELDLPAKVEVKQAKSNYKNGVLDITAPKKKEDETKSEPIKID